VVRMVREGDRLIIRADRTGPRSDFTLIPNSLVNDSRLSWDARGLMALILSRPDVGPIRIPDLQKNCLHGKYKIQRVLDELREHGYIQAANGKLWTIAFIGKNLLGPTIADLTGRKPRNVPLCQVIKAKLLAKYGRYCFWCGEDTPSPIGHHTIKVADGGPDELGNMVLLCKRCHKAAHWRGFR